MTDDDSGATQESAASIHKLLTKHDACPEAVEWAADKESLQTMWDACQEPEWILWSLEQLDYRDDAKLRMFAVACARRHSRLFPDGTGLHILEIAEAVANGSTERAELWTAWSEGQTAADEAAKLPGWNIARAAAISSACDSVRMDPMEAARGASRNGLRARVWDVEADGSDLAEAEWQATALRSLLDEDLPVIFKRARKALADSTR